MCTAQREILWYRFAHSISSRPFWKSHSKKASIRVSVFVVVLFNLPKKSFFLVLLCWHWSKRTNCTKIIRRGYIIIFCSSLPYCLGSLVCDRKSITNFEYDARRKCHLVWHWRPRPPPDRGLARLHKQYAKPRRASMQIVDYHANDADITDKM
jgi:hypothetical protein